MRGGPKYVSFLMCPSRGEPKPPVKKYPGDAGWDLFCSRPVSIPAGETVDVHTDIRLNMPPFIFARIIGRSSTMRRHNLLVNEAIIDNDYTGDMFISIRNMGPEPFEVQAGMRLAQIIFHSIEDVRWAEVELEDFREGKRGTRGFGSTGLYEVE